MNPLFLSHPDFASQSPIDVFSKEHQPKPYAHPAELLQKHILYRRTFVLDRCPASAKLTLTADDCFRLYVNGSFVGEGPTPGYPSAYYTHTVEIAPYLRRGKNVIALHCYYQGLRNRVWVSGDLRQMLWARLTADGEMILCTDRHWRCHEHTGYTRLGQVGYATAFAECYDSAAPEVDFAHPDFDDRHWAYALPHAAPDWKLIDGGDLPIAYTPIAPAVCRAEEGSLTLAFPTEAVGRLEITAHGRSGDRLILEYGEEADGQGNPRWDMRCNCRYREEWILSGREDRLNSYEYKAFRYVRILHPAGVELTGGLLMARHAPYVRRFTYDTHGDAALDAVLSLCENTVHFGTQEQFIDCPTREKGAYLGDMAVSGRAHAILTGDTGLLRRAIENFAHSAFICPGLMAVSAASFMQEIADYSLQFPALLNFVYALDGDLSFLRRMEPIATGIYRYFAAYEGEDRLLSGVREKWNLVDWPANLRDGYDFPLDNPIGDGQHNVINAQWYGLKLAMEELYRHLGIAADLFTQQTRASFIARFYRPSLHLFADSARSDHAAVHGQIFPLLYGLGKDLPGCEDALIGEIARKGLSSMGVYMAYYALAALKSVGRFDLCRDLVVAPSAWPNMIAEGATVTFEAWGKDQKWNTSLFHPWAVAPLIIFSPARVY